MIQPVRGLEVAQPPLILNVREAHVFDLAEALPHDVNVVNVQEDELRTLIVILILIPAAPTDNIVDKIIQIMLVNVHLVLLATALTNGLASYM